MFVNVADFIAGWAGGVFSLIISYPFDTIKVRQQTYHSTFVTAVKDTYKYQGSAGFYRGILSPFLTYGPSNSLFFGVYGLSIRQMQHSDVIDYHISPSDYAAINQVLIAGSIAGFFQTLIYSPVEYVKIILQANTEAKGKLKKYYIPPYRNTYEAIANIYKNSGLFGYYKGFLPMLIRDGPSGGVYMLIYEMLRYSTLDEVNYIGRIGKEVIAGGTAGMLSIACMIPFDVVKTHIQTDNPDRPYFKGTLDCFRKLYASDGTRIFFKGLPVICCRSFPAHAIMFVGYESIMLFFE